MSTTPSQAAAADTFNWDTVFGIRFGDANKAIAAQSSSPANFSSTFTDALAIPPATYAVTGNFGPWALSGGSGDLVQMTLPVVGGALTPVSGSPVLQFSGSADIQVNLEYLPQPGGTGNGQSMGLVLSTTPQQPGGTVATVLSFTFAADSPWSADAEAVAAALGTWLNANLQQFNHTFAVIDVNALADVGAFQWLQPTQVGYAVNTEGAADPDDYVFGVLAMTTTPATGVILSNQISPNVIPAGANAGFLISQQLFLNNIFIPGMALLFDNASAADFAVSEDGTQITNNTPLTFQSFQLDADTTIDNAVVDTGNFTLTAFDQSLELQFVDLNFLWKVGYTVHLDFTGFSTVEVDSNDLLQMPQSGVPSVNTTITQSELSQWVQLGISIVIGLATAVVGSLIGGAVGTAAGAAEREAQQGAAGAFEDAESTSAGSASFGSDGLAPGEVENGPELDQQDDNNAANDIQNVNRPGYVQQFAGWFRRNWKKVLGVSVSSTIAGFSPDIAALILKDYAEGEASNPWGFTQFATRATSSFQWPTSSGFTLVSATLNRSLQLGLNLEYDSE